MEADPYTAQTSTQWVYSGEGRGAYASKTQMEYVGENRGAPLGRKTRGAQRVVRS